MPNSNHQGALRPRVTNDDALSTNTMHVKTASPKVGAEDGHRPYPTGVSSGNAGVTFVRPLAARDVPIGERWTFDHPSMAEVAKRVGRAL